MNIIYATSNHQKREIAKEILGEKGINSIGVSLEVKEIQGGALEVAINKAKAAFRQIQAPLFINDSSFSIEALKGFPSAYASYVENTLGDKKILKLLEGEENRKAYYLDTLIYIDKYTYQIFTSKITGKISETIMEGKKPLDRIFIPDKPFRLYYNNTYFQLAEFLLKRKTARGIIFIDDNVVLIHRIRKEKNIYLDYYAIPGGGLEEDETKEEACLREVLEETNLKVTINTFIDLDIYETGISYYYLTNYHGGTPTLGGLEKDNNNPDNFYEIRLCPVEDINYIRMYGKGQEVIKKAYRIKQQQEGIIGL